MSDSQKAIQERNEMRSKSATLWKKLRPDQIEYANQCMRSWGWYPHGLIWTAVRIAAARKALRNRP